MGKRKIKIETLEDRKKKDVTFSKRRKGIFHKAYELGNLGNFQCAIVVFSPAGNPFTFVSNNASSANFVIQHYLKNSRTGDESLDAVTVDCEAEETKVVEDDGFWWERVDVGNYCSIGDLSSLKNHLQREQENFCSRINDLTASSSSSDETGNTFEDLSNSCNILPELASPSTSHQEETDDIFKDLPELTENICSQSYDFSSLFSFREIEEVADLV